MYKHEIFMHNMHSVHRTVSDSAAGSKGEIAFEPAAFFIIACQSDSVKQLAFEQNQAENGRFTNHQ